LLNAAAFFLAVAPMHFSICNELFEHWPWPRLCQFVSETGYEGLEVAPFTLAPRAELISPAQRTELRTIAESYHLQIVGLHWLLVGPQGLHITHPGAHVRRQTADYFNELVSLCADLGGSIMVIGSPKQRNLLDGVTREQAIVYSQEVFRPCLDGAAARGVTLALEPLAPQDTTFIQSAAEAIELIRQINHPAFRLNLDVKAMSAETRPIRDIIYAAEPYLAHVQANDPNSQGPGMGSLDYSPIIAALRDIRYTHWLSVEPFDYSPGAETTARASLNYLHSFGS
jgi:sugar phosphate isomerase/epimerase